MSSPVVSAEVAGALAAFFHGGSGPSHSKLSTAFAATGYGADDPYDIRTQTPNKESRVRAVVSAALRRPTRARELVERLLVDLRLHGCFDSDREANAVHAVTGLRRALKRQGWALSADGMLSQLGDIDLATGGRDALDEQLDRLRRSTEDPAALLGSAKDLLEAVAKFVLEELGSPQDGEFSHLWYLARDRLGIHPTQVAGDSPGAEHVRKIVGAAWMIAEQVNALRNLQGTGHGRTLPTGVSAAMALLVVRQACTIAAFMLETLDRTLGRPAS